MSKKTLIALRTLPENWLTDDVHVMEVREYVICCHKDRAAIKWDKDNGWVEMKFVDLTGKPIAFDSRVVVQPPYPFKD